MVDYLKGWMGFKKKEGENEIPEIHLQKNEQKFYYDEKLKKYVFEGENPEEDAKPTLPPPKIIKGNTDKPKNKKVLKGANRYVSALGPSNIISSPVETPSIDENEKNKKDLLLDDKDKDKGKEEENKEEINKPESE